MDITGGTILVQCAHQTGEQAQLLTLDYVTDAVLSNVSSSATPYVTPDSKYVIMVDEETGKIDIHIVSENGKYACFSHTQLPKSVQEPIAMFCEFVKK